MSDIYAAHAAVERQLMLTAELKREYRREWDNEKAARERLERENAELEARLICVEKHWKQTMSDELEKAHERFQVALENVDKAIAPEGTWQRRAERAEARVAKLEEENEGWKADFRDVVLRCSRLEKDLADAIAANLCHIPISDGLVRHVAESLAPLPGHVAVMLPREDVERWSHAEFGINEDTDTLRKACRKALEADDE